MELHWFGELLMLGVQDVLDGVTQTKEAAE